MDLHLQIHALFHKWVFYDWIVLSIRLHFIRNHPFIQCQFFSKRLHFIKPGPYRTSSFAYPSTELTCLYASRKCVS